MFSGQKEGKYLELEKQLSYVKELQKKNGNAVNHEMLKNHAK